MTSLGHNWVQELDNLESARSKTHELPGIPNTSRSISGGNRMAKKKITQAQELEQEMKLLQWHKLANEAALKAALIKTKKLKKEDEEELRRIDAEERAEWMQQIIEEEQHKPIEVSIGFMKKYQDEEKREEGRKEAEVRRHINSLQNLKNTLKEREEMRMRQLRFKQGKAELESISLNQQQDILHDEQQKKKQENQKQPSSLSSHNTSISKTIDSLDKLVNLEKRITDLENDQIPQEEVKKRSSAPVSKTRSRITFTKKKSDTAPNEPSRTYYSAKLTSSSLNSRKKQPTSTFITSVPEKRSRSVKKVSTRRMTDRQKRTVARLEKKSSRARAARKTDAVVDGWLKKKKTTLASRKKTPIVSKLRTSRGASSGRKSSNMHVNQLNEMKRNVEKRKERIRNRTSSSSQVLNPKPAWGSKVKSVPTPHQRASSFLQAGMNKTTGSRRGQQQNKPSYRNNQPRGAQSSRVSLPRVTSSTRSTVANSSNVRTIKGRTGNARGGGVTNASRRNVAKKPTNVSLPAISNLSIGGRSGGQSSLGLGVVGAGAGKRMR